MLYDEIVEVERDTDDIGVQSISCKSSSNEEFILEDEEKIETDVQVIKESPLEKENLLTPKENHHTKADSHNAIIPGY